MATRVLNPTPIHMSLPSPSSRGKILFDTAVTTVGTIHKACSIFDKIRREPARFGTAVTSCTAGTVSLLSGNLIFGVSCLAVGGREIYNFTKKPEDPVKILQGVTADVETIGLLAKSQEEHLSSIKEKLDVIKSDVVSLHTSLDDIRTLNKSGIKDIESHLEKAKILNDNAIKKYEEAEKKFTKAQNLSQEAQAFFAQSAQCFVEILDLAKQPEPDVEAIRQKVTEALTSCNEGRMKLSEAESAYAEAFGIFHQAYALKTQFAAEIAIATVKAKAIMESTAEKAKYDKKFQKKWNALQEKVAALEEDLKEILALIDELKDKLAEADIAIRAKLDLSDLFVGVVGALGSLPFLGMTLPMLIPAGFIGMGSGIGWHFFDGPSKTTHCIDQFLFGDTSGPVPFLRKGEHFRAEFDRISSGAFNAYVRRLPSKTVGSILLNLPGFTEGCAHPTKIRFASGKVPELDQLKLYRDISERIQKGEMHPQHALNMLKLLTTPQQIQGSETTVRVFKENGFYVRRIEALCKKKQGK